MRWQHGMISARLQADLLAQLARPFTGEALFDCTPDLVFFLKNRRGEYVVVNQALVERCGRRDKSEVIGRRPDALYPPPFGALYRAQDDRVLKTGDPVLNHLELHVGPGGRTAWCITHKLPLVGKDGTVAGLAGLSKDLQASGDKSQDFAPVAEAVRIIQSRYDEPLKVGELAARVGLSIYQFEQRLRRIFQLTAGQFIQKVRMDAAIRRLHDSEDPISSIALGCGYSDQSAFTRQFRLTVGLSPAQFRRASRVAGERS